LIENREVFKKFLRKAQFSYQISLSEWNERGKEEVVYNKIQWINEVITSLEWISESMQKFQNEIAEKEKDL
jgi:hypothetical protein